MCTSVKHIARIEYNIIVAGKAPKIYRNHTVQTTVTVILYTNYVPEKHLSIPTKIIKVILRLDRDFNNTIARVVCIMILE